MTRAGYIAKALIGATIAGLGALAAGIAEGGLSSLECVIAALAFFTALGAVYKIPNSGG